MLTLDKIYHAKFVLKQVARKTDLIAATRLCPGTDLYLKTENLQVTGSFKVRGAYYKISQLSAEERAKGVIACSAGNHAQGVALAATRMGIKSVVCMPDGAPIMKVESTKRLGAEVELVKGTYDDAHDRAVELQEQTGMTFIHPYDDELVIAGQGTIGLEILDQLPDVDAVIVPIGGGGLISGVAFAIIREDMLDKIVRDLPTMVAFRTHVENGSMFNTPPVFPIYVLKETLKWLKSIGGVPEIYRRNQAKAALLYDEIDRNPLFRGTVDKEDRSLMNICFVMADGYEELAPEFMEAAKSRGIVGIKGHRLVGGFRASCYNALPVESVRVLVECMQEFAAKHAK